MTAPIDPQTKEQPDRLASLDALDGALIDLLARHVARMILGDKDRSEESDE